MREEELTFDIDGLLPCPFCGGEAFRRIKHDILTVGCNNCLISFANHVRLGCLADATWNTRFEAKCPK